jgi:hypothetical protein
MLVELLKKFGSLSGMPCFASEVNWAICSLLTPASVGALFCLATAVLEPG